MKKLDPAHLDAEQIAARALASLRAQGPAEPPADFAARVAAHALSAPRPSALAELLSLVRGMARPAAALGCAAALVLGVVSVRAGAPGGAAEVPAGDGTLALVSADDAIEAVLPFSIDGSAGGGR